MQVNHLFILIETTTQTKQQIFLPLQKQKHQPTLFFFYLCINQNTTTMSIYLDPKADLTFKKVFAYNPHLLISFLNALLPIGEDEQIEHINYLSPEMVPDNPAKKNSIVDVRCTDQKGRHYIVEMQMIWSSEFKQRVLFNTSKAYIRQLDQKEDYKLLEPVYSLNIVDDVFEKDMPNTYYHHYQLVHSENTKKVIDGFQLVFIELPKFKPQTFSEKKMHVLWLRYLTEINKSTRTVDNALTDNPQINQALDIVKSSAYSESELLGYDKFWDYVRVEKTLINAAENKGLAIGREIGREEGIAEGIEKGKRVMAKKMKANNIPIEEISIYSGLSIDEIKNL